jgi:uncharacterized Zn-binding protein involved in type VI secretion
MLSPFGRERRMGFSQAFETLREAVGLLPQTERYLHNGQVVSDLLPSTAATNSLTAVRVAGSLAPTAHEAERQQVTQSIAERMLDAPKLAAGAVLGGIAAGIAEMTELEMSLSAALVPSALNAAASSFAVGASTMSFGLPHAHAHPPSFTPPSPPAPLPSVAGFVVIPLLSGASTVQVAGMAAFRCGDMGVAFGCGGFFPMCELLTGSANVWIEGMRASRSVLDITKHCTFSSQKPGDPPLGPPFGATVLGSANVIIGGIPLPSFTNLAIGYLMHGVIGFAGAFRRAQTAERCVDRLLRRRTIRFMTGASEELLRRDLVKIAETATGRHVLNRIENAVLDAAEKGVERFVEIGPRPESMLRVAPDGSQYISVLERNASALGLEAGAAMERQGSRWTPSSGSSSRVLHSPEIWENGARGAEQSAVVRMDPQAGLVREEIGAAPRGTTSDSVLLHELNHSANQLEGIEAQSVPQTDLSGQWSRRWKNCEEWRTVHVDNAYRRERGLPRRPDYTTSIRTLASRG